MFCPFLSILEPFVPPAAREHFRNSAVEFIKGIASLADLASFTAPPRPEKQGTRIEVL